MTRLNLLHVIPYYAPAWAYGGAVRAATDLTRALVAAGHNVHVLTTDTLSPAARITTTADTLDGVRVTRVRNRSNWLRGRLNLSSPVGLNRALRGLLRREPIDVVHLHELRTVENWIVAPVAHAAGVPVCVSPHGTLPYDTGRSSIKRGWDRLVGAGVLHHIDHVIALTAHEAADARAIWSACGVPLTGDEISTVPNGVHLDDFAALPDPALFRTQWGLGVGPVVLFLGRLHARKGLHLLIPAFAQAVRAQPEARLVIAGPDEGMRATLDDLVQQHGLGGRVVFTGMLDGDAKLAALAAADLFALPAVGEGFSMAVLEAMACGLPVILTPGCNFPEAADAGAGVIVERAIEPLAAALADLLTDDARRAAMGDAARALITARYTWPQIAAQMVAVYSDLVRAGRAR